MTVKRGMVSWVILYECDAPGSIMLYKRNFEKNSEYTGVLAQDLL